MHANSAHIVLGSAIDLSPHSSGIRHMDPLAFQIGMYPVGFLADSDTVDAKFS